MSGVTSHAQHRDLETRVPSKPPVRARVVIAAVVCVALTAVSCAPGIGVGVDLRLIARNWDNGAKRIAQLLHPDFTFFVRTLPQLSQTLQMAFIASIVSAVICVPLIFWAAALSNQNGVGRRITRFIMDVIRAVPDLLYASILVAMVGVGPLPGIIALVLVDIGILVKLLSESVDALDPGLVEAADSAGATRWQTNRLMIWPATVPAYLSQLLYVLELNVRASSILGLVGAGGLGLLIDSVRTYYRYDQLSMIILEILVVVVVLDTLSAALRRRLI